jgi:hypothetical protein
LQEVRLDRWRARCLFALGRRAILSVLADDRGGGP